MKPALEKFLICLLILSLKSTGLFSQTHKIDSLRNQLSQAAATPAKTELIIKLCEQHVSLPPDSLLKYIHIGEKLVVHNSPDYFRIKSFYNTYLSKTGKVTEALSLSDSFLKEIPREKELDQVRLSMMGSHGNLLIRNNEPKEAIETALKYLQESEQMHDTLSMVRAYGLLGWANMELENYTDAINWLNKGISLHANEAILQQTSFLFSNIASSYNNTNQRDSAFSAIEKALYYSKADENLLAQANVLNIRADMYLKENNYAAAENDLKEALHAREQIGDALYIIADMAQLSSFYASINQPEKGIDIAKKGIVLAKKMNNLSQLIFLNNSLAENYKKANQLNEYSGVLVEIIKLKDLLYEKNSSDAIAEMGTKYELQKKENIIIQQENKIAQNRYLTIGMIVFIILLSLLAGLFYRNRQLVRLRKMEAALVEQKILAAEAVKEAEENERKRIAADLHDNLGSFAAAITTNVKNLKEGTIEKEVATSQLEENAQNMVSQLSDTIWVLKNEHLPFTKLADRFKIWMQRLIKNYPGIKYHYTEEIINDVEFTPVKILHIFLILKECVTNSLKHSNCTDLKISFTSNNHLEISIEDNGKGFRNSSLPEKEWEGFGSGIANIKYRAAECGWEVEWLNASPTGTRVLLTATTTK